MLQNGAYQQRNRPLLDFTKVKCMLLVIQAFLKTVNGRIKLLK